MKAESRVVRQWRSLFRLSAADRLTIFQANGSLLVLPILLRLLSFRRTQALLLRLSPARTAASVQEDDVRRVVMLTNRICGWRVLRVNCLKRSLTLWWLLRWRGIDSAVRLGVRKTNTGFEAHAWVERNGEVLGERPGYVKQFVPFAANFADQP